MSLEHENQLAILGKFRRACEGPLLDWRMKCLPDEVLQSIGVAFAGPKIDEIVYRAIIKSTSSINHRELWLSEGGDSEEDDCCPSTANTSTEIAEFQLPKMEWVSIGVKPRCWKDWRDTFCQRYPIYKSCNPFQLVGNSIVLREPESDATRTFMGMVQSELTQAVWDHIYRTAWVGKKERADEWDGILRQLENGLIPLDPMVDHPTTPTTLNWAAYIHGQAAADAGVTAGWGDVVLELTDPDRPADVPANNIWTVFPGLSCEFEVDLTGKNLIDVLRIWYEYVEISSGINVMEWMLAIGRNKWKCAAEVAACMPGCQNAQHCQSWLVNDTRNTGRTEREIDYVNNRRINIHPYPDATFSFYQSPVLADLNKVLFIPRMWVDASGETSTWLLWVWRNQNQELTDIFGDIPALREELDLLPGNLFQFDGELYDGSEFAAGQLFEDVAFLWRVSLTDCDRLRWWVDAEVMMLIQCPWMWLIIDGVDCYTVTQCCDNNLQPDVYELASCADATPSGNYLSAIDVVLASCEDDGTFEIGDLVDYLENVNTTHRGVITAWDAGTCSMTIEFETAGVVCELGVEDVLARVRVVKDNN